MLAMKRRLLKAFKEPSSQYRGAPFWSWNDELTPEELVRQVHEMKCAGMGGFFMHSRDGLETEYMGSEWMECVKATVDASKETDMGAWLYDEDRWPSGAAGGLVPALGGDASRAKGLTMEVRESLDEVDADVLAVFKATLDGEKILKLQRLEEMGDLDPRGEQFLIFRREIAMPTPWYNGDSPADNLSPESVALFIETTYEAYKGEVGEEFGKAIPGIFTDEPNIDSMSMASGRPHVPWTDILPEYFRERRGYDILDILPYLFLEGSGTCKARHDYNMTITELFCHAFTEQIGEWCHENSLLLTGHYLYENYLGHAIRTTGAVMPHYQYQQLPGIDILREKTDEYITVKQCTSVARQFGRRRVLSETYGCSGWEFTFEGQKWVGDWQYVMGVNLRCQHLALYSLRGCRKRDYPPSFNYNTTWWHRNKVVEDYFARLGLVLSSGEAVRDILVLHPVSTGWTMVGAGRAGIPEANALGDGLNDFMRRLLSLHFDFDLGDELIISRKGSVDHGTFVINKAKYQLVIIPPGMKNLLSSTFELLRIFVESGGKLMVVGSPPSMIDGEVSQELHGFFQDERIIRVTDEYLIGKALGEILPRRISLLNEAGIEAPLILHMEVALDDPEDARAFFLVNNDRDNGYRIRVDLKGYGRLEEWDPLTGEIKLVPVSFENGFTRFYADFSPTGSKLYLLFPREEPLFEKPPVAREVGAEFIGPLCEFERMDPNILTLDVCSYRLVDTEMSWSQELPVWQAQRVLRKGLGMEEIYRNGLIQRYKWVNKPHPKDGTPVEFRFRFQVDEVTMNQVYLLLEGAHEYQVFLNGQMASSPEGWYLDRAFQRVPLPKLNKGENEIILKCAYKNRMELEDIYLAGDFGVDIATRAIIGEPEKLAFGDWCSQGYPNYAGTITYYGHLKYKPAPGERVVITLGEYSAVTVSISVNEDVVGHIPWPSANGIDITEYLIHGDNIIGIQVTASPRNMLGPFHRAAGPEPSTSWISFRTEGNRYTSDYVLEPYGLFGQVRCSILRD